MQIRGYTDVAGFRERVEPWLLRHEAEHNLILGLLPRIEAGDHGFEEPVYLAAVERGDEVAGCAFRTPPFKLGLTRMPMEAVEALVHDVAAIYSDLPAVLGPEAEATRFAELWSQRRGCRWSLGVRQRIHALARVIPPDTPAQGELRRAVPDDRALVVDWMEAFARETRTVGGDISGRTDELIREGSVHIWQDREPRTLVAAAGRTPGGTRVGYVYTPPSQRCRGYATSAVAALSWSLLHGKRRFCFLYTDLANETSNALYARVGYEPVCDVVDVEFS